MNSDSIFPADPTDAESTYKTLVDRGAALRAPRQCQWHHTSCYCAGMRNFMIMEFHGQDVDWWDDLVVGDPLIRDGYITLPDKPGLGLTLNDDVARAHVRPDSTFFE